MPSEYTHRLCIAAPLSIQELANAIGRALDPDTGGALSFASTTAGDPPTHAICDVIATTEFAAQCSAMLGHAEYLHGAVAADYAARWADLIPPTLTKCEQFLGECLIAVEPRGRDLVEVLAGMGLVLTPPNVNPA